MNMLNYLRFSITVSRRQYTFFSLCSHHSIHSPAISSNQFKSPAHQTLHFHLQKCSTIGELKLLHAQIILHGLTQQKFTLSKLVSFCAVAVKGHLQYAQLIFDRIHEPNRYMYNSLIRGYSNSSDPTKAILLYRQMISSGICPNEFTFPFVLKACASILAHLEGVSVHVQALKLGFWSQVCVQNSLINVHNGCGSVQCARKVFDDITYKTLVSWNSMIGGYSKMGLSKEAFLLFREMRELGLEPDGFTFVSLLSVSSQSCDVGLGRFVHLYIEINGIKTDIFVRNALLDMYAKCRDLRAVKIIFDRMVDKNVISWTSMIGAYAKHGLIGSAKTFFDRMPLKNVVSWNSMIQCHVQEGCFSEALDLFWKMCNLRVVPDETTLLSVLPACSQLGDFFMGKRIHDYISCNNMLPSVTLYNALIDMHAKCGSLETAMGIFHEMTDKNVVSWNVMIGALALHGCGFKAVELFEQMEGVGIWPDEITFIGLLSACCHSGLVDIGRYYFNIMTPIYGVPCEIEHYACMIDLLGRVGLLGEAVKLIGQMPMRPDIVVWGALLGACRIHGNIETGKQIMKQLLELEPYSGGLYVLISNIFCEAQRWKDVKKIRKLMDNHGIKKGSAISSIEIDGCLHEFMVDDQSRETSSYIYIMLNQLTDHLKSLVYSCNLSTSFLDVEE